MGIWPISKAMTVSVDELRRGICFNTRELKQTKNSGGKDAASIYSRSQSFPRQYPTSIKTERREIYIWIIILIHIVFDYNLYPTPTL